MSVNAVVIQGTLKPDGTLDLDEPVRLPAGRVQVTVQPVAQPSQPQEDVLSVLQRIWAAQRARGFTGRSKDAIDAEIAALREEADERMQEIERLHETCRQQGRQPE